MSFERTVLIAARTLGTTSWMLDLLPEFYLTQEFNRSSHARRIVHRCTRMVRSTLFTRCEYLSSRGNKHSRRPGNERRKTGCVEGASILMVLHHADNEASNNVRARPLHGVKGSALLNIGTSR